MSAFNPISLSALAPDLCSALYRVPLTIGEYEELKARNVKLEEWVRNAEEQVREATAGEAKASTIPGTKPLSLVLLEQGYEIVIQVSPYRHQTHPAPSLSHRCCWRDGMKWLDFCLWLPHVDLFK